MRWSDPADSPLDHPLLRPQCTVKRLGIVGCRHVLPPVAQDILVEYLDIAASTPGMLVIGTSNLDLSLNRTRPHMTPVCHPAGKARETILQYG